MKASWEKLAPLSIVFLTLAVYARVIDASYVWDDIPLIAQNRTLDDASNIPRYFVEDLGHFNRDRREMGFYRPLQALTFHLEIALFGRRPPVQHTVNILFHALAALAVFSLAKTLVRSRPWALFAGLLFAAHPLATEQVCFIADRGGVMVGAFSLWTLALVARALPISERSGVRMGALIGAGAVYVLALLSKDEALTMAAPAAAWIYLASPERRTDAKSYAAAVAPIAALAGLYILWRWGILGISHASRASYVPGGLEARLLAIPRLALEALRLTLVPVGLRPMRFIDYPAWTAGPVVAASAAAWIALFIMAWKMRNRAPAVAFGAFFFAAALAPSSGVVPLIRPIAEHYDYLPAAGVCIALAGIGALIWETAGKNRLKRNAVTLAAALLLAGFAAGTVFRCGFWKSEERLWADNVKKTPGNAVILTNLGIAAAEANELPRALDLFQLAITADPKHLKARVNRARAALLLGVTEGVLGDLQVVLRADPCHDRALMQLGRLIVIGDDPASRAFAEEWAGSHPCAALFEAGAGMVYEERGRPDEAREAYLRFLSALPAHPLAAAVKARPALGGREP